MSQFLCVERETYVILLLRVSQGYNQGVAWRMVSSRALLGKVLLPGSLRTQFLVFIGLRASAFC